jgi:hypothetical protein
MSQSQIIIALSFVVCVQQVVIWLYLIIIKDQRKALDLLLTSTLKSIKIKREQQTKILKLNVLIEDVQNSYDKIIIDFLNEMIVYCTRPEVEDYETASRCQKFINQINKEKNKK